MRGTIHSASARQIARAACPKYTSQKLCGLQVLPSQGFATCTSDQREYTVRVFTGDFRGAGTDAVVHASLHGTEGVSSKHTISSGEIDKSSMFDYTIVTDDIGALESISIGTVLLICSSCGSLYTFVW